MTLSPLYQRAARILRDAGARALLTGQGGDQLFTGDMIYFADRLVREPVLRVLGDVAHIAALGRIPFWSFAYKDVFVPLLPAVLQRRALREMNVVPRWIRKDTLRRAGVAGRIDDLRYSGPVGQKYAYCHAAEFERLELHEEWIALSDIVSVRHPFLFRPLVEFALRLPPELCVRPHARRWVMREAMRGILPESVRTRVGKGGNASGVSRAFSERQQLFREIARNPILADLGLVDAQRLAQAIADSYRVFGRHQRIQADAISTLTIELWLQRRAGRWPHGLIMPHALPVDRELMCV
jgi:asparagine synthase (glutamine-hydrolysing)